MKTENGLRVVEPGDQFFDEVYYVWRPVPVHWHGDTVERLDFSIRANPFANPQPVQTNP